MDVQSTTVLLNADHLNVSEDMANTVKYVNISGVDGLNGGHLIMRLKERRKEGESSVTNLLDSQSNRTFFENTMHNNQEILPPSNEATNEAANKAENEAENKVANEAVNYSNFMIFFKNMNTPPGSTVQEIKAYLALQNFHINSKLLRTFLDRALSRDKIEKINGKYKIKAPTSQN